MRNLNIFRKLSKKRVKPINVLVYPVHGKHSVSKEKLLNMPKKELEKYLKEAEDPLAGMNWEPDPSMSSNYVFKEPEPSEFEKWLKHNDNGSTYELADNLEAAHKYEMSDPGLDYLKKYTASSYLLNKSLIDYHNAQEKGIHYEHEPHNIERIENLDRALDSKVAPQPLTVYHGTGFDPEKFASRHPDRIIRIPSFTSTSLDKRTAKKFSMGVGDPLTEHILSIDVPQGFPSSYIAHISRHPLEWEYLLPRGTNFQISNEPIVKNDRFSVWKARPVGVSR